MTFRQKLNLRFISQTAIAFAVASSFNFAASNIYAKAEKLELAGLHPYAKANTHDVRDHNSNIESAEQRVAVQPTPENYVELSNAYWYAKRYQDCVKAAQSALELKPDYPQAYNNLAAGYGALGRYDAEIDAAKQAIQLRPDFQLAQNNLNWALAQLRHLDENIASTEQLITKYPVAGNYLQLSKAYYDAKRYQDCIEAANKALASKSDYAVAYNNICASYNNLCDFEDAKKAGEQAVNLEPSSHLFKNNLRYAVNTTCEDEAISPQTTSNNATQSTEGISPQAPVSGTSLGMTLEQSYPNPTSNFAIINFSLTQRSPVKLRLFDVMGRQVQSLYDAIADPGAYSIPFDASLLPSGTYGYVLTTPSASLSRSLIISK